MLESFHHRVARRIAGKVSRLVAGIWIYLPLEEALVDTSLYPMREYNVRRHQASIEQYIALCLIRVLCEAAPCCTGSSSRILCWWHQDHAASVADVAAPADGTDVDDQ